MDADRLETAPEPPAPALPGAEAFSLSLSLGGRYAGEQHWVVTPERGALGVRVQTDFGGVLPEIRRVQTSRMHARFLTSLGYSEGDGRSRAAFETSFDRRNGLVTLRQGRDEASAPLTTDHHDPVSLIMWLRTLGEVGPERTHAQLTGGRVLIQRLSTDGDTLGYFLRPGSAYVYVERGYPHRPVRLVQPTDFGPVEATLTLLPPAPRRPERPERRRRR